MKKHDSSSVSLLVFPCFPGVMGARILNTMSVESLQAQRTSAMGCPGGSFLRYWENEPYTREAVVISLWGSQYLGNG